MQRPNLIAATGRIWARVTGLATALVATLTRLNWEWLADDVVIDDLGNELVFGLDPPSAFVAAVNASVRRWRLGRIIKMFPHVAPQFSDVFASTADPTVIIDFFGFVSPLANGKASIKNTTTSWGYLLGAFPDVSRQRCTMAAGTQVPGQEVVDR